MIRRCPREWDESVGGQGVAGESGSLERMGDVYAFWPGETALGGRSDGGTGGNGQGKRFERANKACEEEISVRLTGAFVVKWRR